MSAAFMHGAWGMGHGGEFSPYFKPFRKFLRFSRLLAPCSLLVLMMLGCGDDMRNQPRFEPLEKTTFYADGRSARDPVEGTVARGFLQEDELLYTGKMDGKFADIFPFPVDEAVLKRGQERYNIYCAVCHDRLGYGQGMVVQRGFKQAPSYHEDRLREMPAGYLVNVIANGFGSMPDFRAEVKPADRWAIAAYIRTLQFSQHVEVDRLSETERKELLSVQS